MMPRDKRKNRRGRGERRTTDGDRMMPEDKRKNKKEGERKKAKGK